MIYLLCTEKDFTTDDGLLPMPWDTISEEEAQRVVLAVTDYFRVWLDGRSCLDLYPYSQRAINVMRREGVHTVSDLAEWLVRARLGQIRGAGEQVQREWMAALTLARQRGAGA